MELMAGYKQTEVGVIPEDWDAVPLAALGDFSKGSGVRKHEAKSGDLPCIRYGEIYTHHNDIVRDFHSYISRAVAATAKRLKRGDILFAGSGETKEEIGKAASFVSCAEAYAGGDIVILSPRTCSSEFLAYALNAPEVARQKSNKGQGDAVVHISTSALASISVAVPPLPEQSAIATALSNVDALLAAQDALIAKKRAIKQGAMQELLTGKRRLPGFSGEWEVRRLGDVLTICHGRDQKDVASPSGEFPILATGGRIGWATCWLYDKPSVLIGRKGTIDRPQYMDAPFWTVDTLFYSELKDDHVAKFFYYRCCMIDWHVHNEASGVPSLNARTIEQIEVSVPSPAEQASITAALDDMAAEITALETQRVKTAQLKQGMMQALLTGRIRLV